MEKENQTGCMDKHCPFHGDFGTRGASFKGKMIKIYGKTGTIEFGRSAYIRKYERFLLKRSRLKVHIPECVKVNVGDVVIANETRPISKTKHFVVVKNESD